LFRESVVDEHGIYPANLTHFLLRAKSKHYSVCLKAFSVASLKLSFRSMVLID
jgi:hypothetical protein